MGLFWRGHLSLIVNMAWPLTHWAAVGDRSAPIMPHRWVCAEALSAQMLEQSISCRIVRIHMPVNALMPDGHLVGHGLGRLLRPKKDGPIWLDLGVRSAVIGAISMMTFKRL